MNIDSFMQRISSVRLSLKQSAIRSRCEASNSLVRNCFPASTSCFRKERLCSLSQNWSTATQGTPSKCLLVSENGRSAPSHSAPPLRISVSEATERPARISQDDAAPFGEYGRSVFLCAKFLSVLRQTSDTQHGCTPRLSFALLRTAVRIYKSADAETRRRLDGMHASLQRIIIPHIATT